MKYIGRILIIKGIASSALHFAGRELKLLMWISSWGTPTDWIIRIGLIVVGAILWGVGHKIEKNKGPIEEETTES